MLRLRGFNHMCSRMVSDTANRLLKRTDSEGSPSVAEKKSSAVPYFAAVTCRQSAPDSPRERGDSQEGGNRRCLPSCAPARRQRTPPLRFSEKLSARQGRTRLRQFVSPAQPVLKKGCRPSGANPLTPFVSPSWSVQKIYTKRAAAPMQQLFSMQNLNRTASKPKFPRRYARSPR